MLCMLRDFYKMTKLNYREIFNKKQASLITRLNTPKKIQEFLDKIPINIEEKGETCLSPAEVLKQNRAHCSEAAMLAAIILWSHGQKPLLMDIKTNPQDYDHVVALYKENGFFGAISKTNHNSLRYRDPIYRNVRELALSYFHEYFTDNGKKTMRSYSAPFDLSKIKDLRWMTSAENVWEVIAALDDSKHFPIISKKQIKSLRKADKIEIDAGRLTEWKPKRRTK
jgi:hypothetical protein